MHVRRVFSIARFRFWQLSLGAQQFALMPTDVNVPCRAYYFDYLQTSPSQRQRHPRRYEIAERLAAKREDGHLSPTVRGILGSPEPPARPALDADFIQPKWGYYHWLKRRKSPPLNPVLKVGCHTLRFSSLCVAFTHLVFE